MFPRYAGRLQLRRGRRLVVDEVVGPVSQAASGKDGDGENGEDSAAHICPLAFVPERDGTILGGAHARLSMRLITS
jgi:hypothetical protein